MRTLLRRLTLWALGLRPDQLEALRQKLAQTGTTLVGGTNIDAGSITGDRLVAGSVTASQLATRSVGLDQLSLEVHERLLPEGGRSVGSARRVPESGASGRLAPQRPVVQETAAVRDAAERFRGDFRPDLAARDSNGGA